MILMPRTKTRERLKLKVKKTDVPRGYRWQKTFTELKTGKKIICRCASCGLPSCYCDAVIIKKKLGGIK